MADTINRFSNRVENYVKYRPNYPREIVAYLAENCGLTEETTVADIGCGTGISSRMFLENGNQVFGVEPNDAMRAAAVEYLSGFPKFAPIDGTSEATTLGAASIDLIVAAQAFHWFELERTRAEFRRVLKLGGFVSLIWNERRLDATPFLTGYERLLLRYANDYASVRHDKIDEHLLAQFFDAPVDKASFENVQVFDFDGICGRMLSSSYMPTESDPGYHDMIADLESLFAKHAERGRIKVFYDTNVYSSRI